MKTILPSVVTLCPAFPSKSSKHLLAIMCAVSALVFVCAATGLAQDLKIGFIDLQKFATKSVKVQAMQKKLVERMKTLPEQPSLKSKEKELAALWEKLMKLDPILNEEAWNQTSKEIDTKKREIKKIEEAELGKSHPSNSPPDTAMVILQPDWLKTIARIRRQKGLSIVFNQTAVLSANDALDITDEVAEAYDAEPEPKPGAPAVAPRPPNATSR